MAKTTPAQDSADDFDDLLADESTTEDTSADESGAEDVESFDELLSDTPLPELTPEQRRIQELEAQLAALSQGEPEVVLTPEQIRIAELEALLAERNAPAGTVAKETSSTGKRTWLFHFVRDGLLVLDNIWLRGQEVEIEEGTLPYDRTFDDEGNTWLDILSDENAQIEKWGDRYISAGAFKPRPGENFEDEVAREDKKRRRRVELRNI